MTTTTVTGKVWKSGKKLVIGVDKEYYDKLRELRGKQLLINITPVESLGNPTLGGNDE